VRPAQAIEIFGDVSTPIGTSAISDVPDIVTGEPLRRELNARGVAKYSNFGPFEGYISETMHDMI